MEILPLDTSFTGVGSFDVKGGGERTLYAWGDFAGGKLIVQAVIPQSVGEEVFDLTDEAGYIEQLAEEIESEVGADLESPIKLLELTDRGFIKFNIKAPIVRISLIDCVDTPDVKVWLA